MNNESLKKLIRNKVTNFMTFCDFFASQKVFKLL